MKDKIKKNPTGGAKLPRLHGHAVLTLNDAQTGREIKRIEKDNMITNAVGNIFAENLLGSINYTDLTPVRNMFGGIMLFYDALTEQADTTQVPNPLTNPLIAYAGQTAHATANPMRGNPNNASGGSGPTLDGKGYKFVWDWANNQGNGTISAAALTYKDFGDICLTPNPKVSGEYLTLKTCNKSVVLASGTRSERGDFADYLHGLICVTDNGATGFTYDFNSKVLTKVELYYKGQGVNNAISGAKAVSDYTTTVTPTQYGGITWDRDTGLFYIIDFPTTSQCAITEIDFENETETTKTFSGTFNRITPPTGVLDAAFINKFAKSGNYFFVYTGSGMARLDWSNPSDVEPVDFTNFDGVFSPSVVDFGQVSLGESVVMGAGFVVYGLNAYAIDTQTLDTTQVGGTDISFAGSYILRHALTDDPEVNVSWVWVLGNNTSRNYTFYAGLVYIPYLATVQNLEDVVTKDSTMTMKVVYTITLDE